MFTVSERYAQRPVRFLELMERDGWRLKLYSIRYGEAALDRAAYEEGLRLALPALPRPAQTASRPGVGFVILHQGRGWHYLVLSWWDNENEYFNRVFVRPLAASEPWREATSGETACVWDLEVIWFERQAYVETVLGAPGAPELSAYLARRLTPETRATP
jgi:hypothetical protein